MRRKICLFLIVCMVLSYYVLPIFALNEEYVDTDSDGYSLSVDLLSSNDFYVELEKEGINAENSEEYNICLLIEARENDSVDLTNLQASNIIKDDNEIDDALFQHRDMLKNYYSVHNQYVIDQLLLNECNYFVSFYTPYIEVIFDDVAEYAQYEEIIINAVEQKQDLIVSLSNFAVLEQGFDDATINSPSTATYPFDEALADMGVADYGFTGAGIKVGVIESGYPNSTTNLKPDSYTFLGNNQTSHSVGVTSIIGGETGIAKDVYFYCLSRGSSLTNDFNMLINTCDVDIINMSNTAYVCGYYTACDAYIDRMISNSGCTIVKSAGNTSTSPDSLVCAPGCSLNCITVGSIDSDKDVSSFSCWVTTEPYLLKPDIVAPGGYISGIDNVSPFPGTSASTPMVTGVIALLMEEFPVLKTNPALVKSVLHLGAESLPSQTNYFDEQAGFGLINYQNMRSCLLNSNYYNFNITTSNGAGDIVLSEYVSIPYLDKIVVNANSIVNSSTTTSDSVSTNPAYTDYSIKIYNTITSTYVATSTIDSNIDYLIFTNNQSSYSSFRIDIVLEDDSNSDATEVGSIAYQLIAHNPSYTYTWISETQHKRTCVCGDSSNLPHVVKNDSFNGSGGNAVCIICKGLASVGAIYSYNVSELPHTANGSYILSNGIIVLVDEDIDAYMNGSLIFYYGEIE